MSSAFFTHPLWSRLAATHLHFLWQGLLIAWLYWAITKIFAIKSARLRYVLGMVGLLAMAVCTVVTFFLVELPQPKRNELSQIAIAEPPVSEEWVDPRLPSEEPARTVREIPERQGASRRLVEPGKPAASALPLRKNGHLLFGRSQGRGDKTKAPINNPVTQPQSPIPRESNTAAESPGVLTLGLLGVWLLGVMILGMRLMGGVGTVLWCRWSTRPLTDPQCLQLVERLSRQVGLARCPRLAISLRAKDAFSLGLWKPLIVLPASWLLQLSPQTMESVLAHELAHIRRWDAWAALFQRVLEAGLFYHPGVWWLSRQMDREREKCCDLWAVSLTGDRLQYVKALAGVAEIQRATLPAKLSAPIFATGMGGKNMQLLERVRHLLGETPRTGAASRIFAGAMVLSIPAALWMGTLMLPANAADEENALLAPAEADRDGDREREGERREQEHRDGDRERGDRERGDRERGDRERGDRERGDRERGDRERGDRERGDRERGDRERGDRERGEQEHRDGDRERGEQEHRDGDRERGEQEHRDGDREREGERRDGDRRPPGRFRDGDRPRRPLPPGAPGFRRDGDAPRDGERELPREGGFRRDGRLGGGQGEMIQVLRELRQEVEALRKEVRALREARGDRRDGDRDFRDPGRPPIGNAERRREFFRRMRGGENERGEREGDRDRPARPEGERREREHGEREREREGDRVDRDEVAREREEGEEALERAREEREQGPARAEGER